jgi:hypothetical protein
MDISELLIMLASILNTKRVFFFLFFDFRFCEHRQRLHEIPGLAPGSTLRLIYWHLEEAQSFHSLYNRLEAINTAELYWNFQTHQFQRHHPYTSQQTKSPAISTKSPAIFTMSPAISTMSPAISTAPCYFHNEPCYFHSEPCYFHNEPCYFHKEPCYFHNEPCYFHKEPCYFHNEPCYFHNEPRCYGLCQPRGIHQPGFSR